MAASNLRISQPCRTVLNQLCLQDPFEFDSAPSSPPIPFSRTYAPGVLKGSGRQKTTTMAEVLNTIRMEEESHDSVISPAVFSDPELEVTHEPALGCFISNTLMDFDLVWYRLG